MYPCYASTVKPSRWMPLEERWAYKVNKTDECWLWTGWAQLAGPYGVLRHGGKTLLAHRLSWEIHRGPIPDGMTVDHCVCFNTLCVNPDHLEIVTRSENSRRMNERYRPPTCPKGHNEFGKRSNGKRYCKVCNRDAYWKRKGT